jgi:methionyl-tRNA formyltransferase
VSSLGTVSLAFAGTPEFAVPTLGALIDAGANVTCVLTQPDRPAGRGRRLTASPIKQLAVRRGIGVLQPPRIVASLAGELPGPRPAVLVVVAYGLILPQWLLDWPEIVAVNVHASLLPRWRGASPIQHAILHGDAQTGVSIMRMTAGLDTGPVYRQRTTAIGSDETAAELQDRLGVLGAQLLVETLPDILSGALVAREQNDAQACYAPKIDKRDARLDWRLPAEELARRVRAYNPWPVAETTTSAGERLRIWRSQAQPYDGAESPGTIVATGAAGIDVATGRGVLRLLSVQPPGGRAMTAAAYVAGRTIGGTVLGALE